MAGSLLSYVAQSMFEASHKRSWLEKFVLVQVLLLNDILPNKVSYTEQHKHCSLGEIVI